MVSIRFTLCIQSILYTIKRPPKQGKSNLEIAYFLKTGDVPTKQVVGNKFNLSVVFTKEELLKLNFVKPKLWLKS
ncbi:hypothetical protein [Paraliobacillus sp. JSM ZJ581]|uniref:hypothetical protein n=1 Tax=Paraliobacillus sp. JSM ZJ581 TaxID=3342118 RepID=UPI0035A8801A